MTFFRGLSLTGARRRETIGALALLFAFGLGFGIVAGFFGDRVYLFDTMAQFRAHAAVALVLVTLILVWAKLYAAALAATSAAALGLVTVLPFFLPMPPAGPALPGMPRYTLLQMNLRYDAPDKSQTLRLIGSRLPDVVTVQEMTGQWEQAFATLIDRYPYQYFCAYPDHDGDAGILSRRPFAEGDAGVCDPFGAFAAKRIDFNGTQVVIGSQHLRWPWPGRQWRQVAALAPKLAGLGDPLIIAGDFNSAPWTASVQGDGGGQRHPHHSRNRSDLVLETAAVLPRPQHRPADRQRAGLRRHRDPLRRAHRGDHLRPPAALRHLHAPLRPAAGAGGADGGAVRPSTLPRR